MYDAVVIGAGIVGASTAMQLLEKMPKAKVLLLDKEQECAQHQTGRNSGVIHAGVYYQPESLKAKFCRQGLKDTIEFCQKHQLPYQQCGKLLVATNELEAQRMEALQQRCEQNEIETHLVSKDQLSQMEPNISGVGAIHVPSTGIVDYKQVNQAMINDFVESGGEVAFAHEVSAIDESNAGVAITAGSQIFKGHRLVVCAGLHADEMVRKHGLPLDFRIIPFRGEYYRLSNKHQDIIKHLIYPIPDPELPFLGVHLTRMIDGSVTVGPNAVLGLKKEGYGALNLDVIQVIKTLSYKGFWSMSKNFWRTALSEYAAAWSKQLYLQRVRKYCPSLTTQDFQPYPTGVRAQAVMDNGDLVHDFLFKQTDRVLHVCNAPSPAATSALPIGEYIVHKLFEDRTGQ